MKKSKESKKKSMNSSQNLPQQTTLETRIKNIGKKIEQIRDLVTNKHRAKPPQIIKGE